MGTLASGPKIGNYSGRGDLRHWLKAVAVRLTIDHQRSPQAAESEDKLADHFGAVVENPELAYLKNVYREEFKKAFTEALRSLPERQILYLQQYYLDGVKLEPLAKIHGVVPSTISRALNQATSLILKRIRAELMNRLGTSAAEVESILRVVGSRLSLPGSVLQKKE